MVRTRMVDPVLYGASLALSLGGFLMVYAVRHPGDSPGPVGYGVLVLLAVPALHVALVRRGFRGDGLLLPVTQTLVGLGLVELYRLQPGSLVRQATWALLGLGGGWVAYCAARAVDRLSRYRYLYALSALVLLVSALVFGVERGGSRQWLDLGFASFQPSEVVKVCLVLFLASYLAEHHRLLALRPPQEVERRILLPVAAVLGASLLILTVQRDLGGALLYLSIVLGMVYVGTGRVEYVAAGALAFAAGAGVCAVLFPHVRIRLEVWVDPWRDLAGSGYQLGQALFALASGGLAGTGLGLGYPELIPAVHTDLVFAAIGEELGYAGALGVILLYMILVVRGFRIALRARRAFSRLLAAGVSLVLAAQTLLILGGSLRLVPLTGIPMPFVSYGGSAMVSNFVLLGLLMGISHHEEVPHGRRT
ncbi:MAG: FtsW/RodA/SpoVE family cell cycle protein [Armatimonadota bacterium]|nr:FtsW/RodA/SpoVE family cell cycle protein [Armatimonadota bacterium]MDR7445359.1 FtsW/RodA/SpoVE family cell cycle protein [Armatimonadota bacterium]MDR7569753.1 FtsW/RodA/SpoVE family cell cycle protein [Armatimonadota bacterium]MDR7614093.1 FtsW/RodA/SpoVE family cell cycle protein [Armatimonadota bacterium]